LTAIVLSPGGKYTCTHKQCTEQHK